jgi:hypothetical protein
MVRKFKNHEVYLTIISSNRTNNIEKMTNHFGQATWIVPEQQVADYLDAGAKSVIGVGQGLSIARNVALERSFKKGLISLQSDDDLTKISRWVAGKSEKTNPIKALEDMVLRLVLSDYCLAGVSPTANPYFITQQNNTNLFVSNSLIAVKPSQPRFDTNLKLNQDYDFTLQHILKYGGVQRCDDILPSYVHYSNKGGCKDYRTDELEKEAAEYLFNKYPDMIENNPAYNNKIQLKVKRNFRLK